MLLRETEVNNKNACSSVKRGCLDLGELRCVRLGKEWEQGGRCQPVSKQEALLHSTRTHPLDHHSTKRTRGAAQEQKVLGSLAVFVTKYKSHVHITWELFGERTAITWLAGLTGPSHCFSDLQSWLVDKTSFASTWEGGSYSIYPHKVVERVK